MLDAGSMKLLTSCADESKSTVDFSVGKKRGRDYALIRRSPALHDVGVLEPGSIAVIALVNGDNWERIPVEVLNLRRNPNMFVCRVLQSSTISQVARGTLLSVKASEIIGIERGANIHA